VVVVVVEEEKEPEEEEKEEEGTKHSLWARRHLLPSVVFRSVDLDLVRRRIAQNTAFRECKDEIMHDHAWMR